MQDHNINIAQVKIIEVKQKMEFCTTLVANT